MVKRIKRESIQKLKEFANHQGVVILVFAAMVIGNIVSGLVFGKTWDLDVSDWIWLAIVSSLLRLPGVFARLKNSQDPYLIRFARAFRAGFLSLSLINLDIFIWKKLSTEQEETLDA